MKLLEFKELLKERLELLKANTIFTTQRELAYAGSNWASLLSTFAYTTAVLVFIKVLFSNIHTLAGYSHNQILFYFFIYQISYYANQLFTYRNLQDLIPDVNKGNLDMILVKPVPSLFFLMTRTISIVSIFTDAIAPMLAIIISINWVTLNITFPNIIFAVLIWICGLISLQTFQLLAAIPVFWFGESDNILDLALNTTGAANTTIPLDGYDQNLQKIFGTFIPILITAGFSTSVLLEKSDPLFLLIWSLSVAVIALIVKSFAWKLALKHYTSASS